jgi:Ion channel
MGRALGGKYFRLSAALLVLALMYPMLARGLLGLGSWTMAFWLVLVGALRVVGSSHRVRRLGRVLAAVAFGAGVAGLACYNLSDSTHGWLFSAFDALTLLFLLLATGVILVDVLRQEDIDGDHILGAACVYILLGLTFAYILPVLDGLTAHPMLATVDSGGLERAKGPGPVRAEYLYFSFVTLSTLGYGDLVPVSLVGRLVAGVEAILGQLFLTILVARLIGLHLARGAVARGGG